MIKYFYQIRTNNMHTIVLSQVLLSRERQERVTFASIIQSHLKISNHLSFSSSLYSGQSGARPELWALWRVIAVFRGLLSGLSLSLLVIWYSGRPRKFSWSHLPYVAYALHVDLPPSHATHANYAVFPPGRLCPVYFWHPHILRGMLKVSSSQYPISSNPT